MKNSIIDTATLLNAVLPNGAAKKMVITTLSTAARYFAENESATVSDFVAKVEADRKRAEENRKERAEKRASATDSAFEALQALA